MTLQQLHVKVDSKLLASINDLVEKGVYGTKKEAVEDALLFVVQRHKAKEVSDRMDALAERMRGLKSFTEAAVESHEEEEEEN